MSDLFWLTDEQMERLRPFFPSEAVALSCCGFRGHRDKVFLEPADGDATTEV